MSEIIFAFVSVLEYAIAVVSVFAFVYVVAFVSVSKFVFAVTSVFAVCVCF